MPETVVLSPSVLLDPGVVDDPTGLYRELVTTAPVWAVPGTDVVVVSSFAAVSEAVQRVDDFSSNLCNLLYRGDDGTPAVVPFGALGDATQVLATADPPVHTLHRKRVFPELVARRMTALRSDIEALADERLDLALDTPTVEFMDTVANAIPIRVVSRLIGFHEEDPDELLAAAFDSTAMLAATVSIDEIHASMARTAEIVDWITAQLDGATTSGADGILGVIAEAVRDGSIDQTAGIVIVHTLLSAGGESTTSLLGNAVHLLATRPAVQQALRDDPVLVAPFVEEALRLESPFRHHLRHAPRATELHGVPVPAGSTLLLLWAAANRDPVEHPAPDDVVLDRPAPRHHLGFGRGIHLCVGAPLARIEATAVITRLLERTEHVALDPADPPERVSSLMVRRFRRLPIVVTT